MAIESEKSKAAETKLPANLRPVYRRMVEEYKFLTHVKYGRGYVAFDVLAQMVLAGWRPSAEPHPSSDLIDQSLNAAKKEAGDED